MKVVALVALLVVVVLSAGWDGAAGVSGSAMLTGGRFGSVKSVSCGAPGDCAAGGYYNDGPDFDSQAFVMNETNGVWGKALEVPGTARLNADDQAEVDSVSCAAPGECAAGGFYADGHYKAQAFVASETGGRWGRAIKVPGTATLNTGGSAEVYSVSCAAPGECAAGGYYVKRTGAQQAFVVSETNGSWGKAIAVPGTVMLNAGGSAAVNSVSCAAAGECVAGGFYATHSGATQAFVVGETNHGWGTAIEVPGTATLNTGPSAWVTSVSCAAAGECAAGGIYSTHGGATRAFVVSETSGSWDTAMQVPGTAALNTGGNAAVASVSCAAAGACVAGGYYTANTGPQQAFVVNETNGSWGNAIAVPGTATLNTGGSAGVVSTSCSAAGQCAAGGAYTVVGPNNSHAFVVDETNGSWGNAIEVPGTATAHGDAGSVASISCAAAGDCAAVGVVGDLFRPSIFVVNETNGSWGNAIRLRNFPASCVVPKLLGKPLNAAKTRLHTAHCRAGEITYTSSTLKKGLVEAEHPKTGRHLKGGSAVALTVSDGTRTTASGVPARIIFPVIGRVRYSDDFGDPRPGGTHQGNDILARRKAPVLAVEGGKIRFWTSSASAGCMLYLHGRSGTMYEYIHLNNDRTNKNDNRGHCVAGVAYAPGLKDGAHVQAGELIGYVGDSGDANGLHPHLHFELHPHGGAAVSPYRWLRRARHLTAPTSRP